MKNLTCFLFLLLSVQIFAQWEFTYTNSVYNEDGKRSSSQEDLCNPKGASARARLNLSFNIEDIPKGVTHYRITPLMNGKIMRGVPTLRTREFDRDTSKGYGISEGYVVLGHKIGFMDLRFDFYEDPDNEVYRYDPKIPKDKIKFTIIKRAYQCITDYDLDGIPNDLDFCPLEFGQASYVRNGCPDSKVPESEPKLDLKPKKANIQVTGFKIMSSSREIYDYFSNNGVLTLGHKAWYDFEITLKNTGNIKSEYFKNCLYIYPFKGKYYALNSAHEVK